MSINPRINVDIQGHIEGNTFVCSGSKEKIECKQGFVAWVMHIFRKNVCLNTSAGTIYVSLAAASAKIEEKNSALNAKVRAGGEKIGRAFASVFHAQVLAQFQQTLRTDPHAAIPQGYEGVRAFTDAQAGARQQAACNAPLAQFQQALRADPHAAIPQEHEAAQAFTNARAVTTVPATHQAPAIESYTMTRKLLEIAAENKMPQFTPLSEAELTQFLDQFPDLMKRNVAQGNMKAKNSILNIHREGIPGRIDSKPANRELQEQMRFIMYYISHAPSEQQLPLLSQLISGLEDCVPVTQGQVYLLSQKLLGGGAFQEQLQAFILSQKNLAIDRVLDQMYPDFKNDGYADAHFHRPSEQQPHVKNGFIRICGQRVGYTTRGAETDPNANCTWAQARADEFVARFAREFSITKLVQEFVRQVNGPMEGALNREIINKSFYDWCTAQGFGPECVYDEDATDRYPTYGSPPSPAHALGTAAYIGEATALKAFTILGYIAPK
jgi:hypothetical protein